MPRTDTHNIYTLVQKAEGARELGVVRMVRSVVIARAHDGLPLAASMNDDELERDFPDQKSKTKTLLKSLVTQTEPMTSVEAGQFFFHILIASGVAYIGLADRLYPKKLAFSLLSDLQRDFMAQYGGMVEGAARPYAFLKFDNTIQRAKRSYQDVRARQNLDRLQEELLDVTKIMTTSINDVLERGNKLENMSLLSSNLSQESKRYLRDTRNLTLMMMWRHYGPIVVLITCLLLFAYVYFKFL